MSRTKKILHQQTVADVAIAWQGSIEAVYDIAVLNGIAITDTLVPGNDILIGSLIYDADVANYYANKNIQPATGFVFVPDSQFDPVNVLVGGELQGTYNSGDVANLNLIDGEGNPIVDFTISGNDIIVPMAGPVEIPDVIFYDDFFHQINGNNEWFWRGRTSTGTVNQATLPNTGWGTNINAVDGRVGIWRIFLSSSATFVSGIYRQNNGISNSVGNGHKLTFEALYVSASGNERGAYSCGYLNDTSAAVDSNSLVTFDNSAYIRYDYFGDSFQLVTSNAGTATVTNITTPVIAGEWCKVEIELTPTECRFFINDVLVGTHTTDIPQLTGVGFSVNRRQGASTVQGVWLDKVNLERI